MMPNDVKIIEHCLPNVCSLYWRENEAGGRTFYSDEIGGGVMVWDTALVDEGTLLMAMAQDKKLTMDEYMSKRP